MATAVVWGNAAAMTVPAKRGNRNERGLHSSANGGRGEILPKRGVLLVNGVLKIARIPSF